MMNLFSTHPSTEVRVQRLVALAARIPSRARVA
jgi:Zn-dependent protease with chaperone function